MGRLTLEECKELLQRSDRSTLERRAERLKELEQIHTDARLFSSKKEWDYAGEASDCYVNGDYRSVIFCCACAVDQIIRYEYLKMPGSRYEDLEKRTFGQAIHECRDKNIPRLRPLIGKAELLNQMRNEVSAHPLFIDFPAESDPAREARNRLLLEDIKKLLNLVGSINSELRDEIEATRLVDEVEEKTYVFGQVVNRECEMPSNLDGFWALIEEDVLKFLAGRAWHILKTTAEGLYGVTP